MESSLGYTIVWFGPLKVTVPLFGEQKNSLLSTLYRTGRAGFFSALEGIPRT